MRYYLDTEFNGMGGELISLALVPEHERDSGLYLVSPAAANNAAREAGWVANNVIPILYKNVPDAIDTDLFGPDIASYLRGDDAPVIVTDWPDDIKYFCQACITGPGEMIDVPSLTFEMHRVDAYPTTLEGAVQHNAWWDAMALRHLLLVSP